eukprot:gene5186-5424_t
MVLYTEAVKPLPRRQDPQNLLRAVNTLITLNVFLASAVFIGLSLTNPDDIQGTLQYLQSNITAAISLAAGADVTSSNNYSTLSMPELVAKAQGKNHPPLTFLSNNSTIESSREFSVTYHLPDVSSRDCWFGKGASELKPTLMAQQVLAFTFFMGSAGVAYAILLSVNPEAELNTLWEQLLVWVPYVLISGVSTICGILFLLQSLITMMQVQYGAYTTWQDCPAMDAFNFSIFFRFFGFYQIFCTCCATFLFCLGWTVF